MKKPVVTKPLKWDLSERRIKEVLWNRFLNAMTIGDTDTDNHNDVCDAMEVVGSATDIIAELTGDPDIDLGDFLEEFKKHHDLPPPPTVTMELPLTLRDRREIREKVGGSCLSQAAKDAILEAIKL